MIRYITLALLLSFPAVAGGGDGGGRDRGCYTCGGGGKVDGRAHDSTKGGIGSGNATGGPGYGTPR